jgi:POT family proton-dependent oligopeptide transporter
VTGTGLLKPNISSIVGQLYAEGDTRRDAGFSIFYMGINLGAFISPLICGYLGQKVGWHWGFGAAGVGMTLGVVQYVLGADRLGSAGVQREVPSDRGKLWGALLGAVAGLGVLLYLLWSYKDFIVLLGVVALFAWLVSQARTPIEKKRTGALIVLFVFATLFWAGFEQAGSSLNLFADQITRNSLLGWDFPSSWFQSVQPAFIILFAPVFAWFWMWLGSKEPSSPAKFAYGLLSVALSFLLVAIAAWLYTQDQAKVSPLWLIGVYLLHSLGEQCLSPVGLSTVTKLAPERFLGLMMGIWFLALSLGNFIGGRIAGLFDALPLPQLFGAVFVTTAASALVLALLTRRIRGLMGGVH